MGTGTEIVAKNNGIGTIATHEPWAFNPANLQEAMNFCQFVSNSELVPQQFRGRPADVLLVIMAGVEIKMKPFQALQSFAVINGRACLWGDALPALVHSHPDCEYVKETYNEQTFTATCIVKRKGHPEHVQTFSRADAGLARLLGKSGSWTTNERRMEQIRARSFAFRDKFADALKGIQVAEEVLDYEPEPQVKIEGETRTATVANKLKAVVEASIAPDAGKQEIADAPRAVGAGGDEPAASNGDPSSPPHEEDKPGFTADPIDATVKKIQSKLYALVKHHKLSTESLASFANDVLYPNQFEGIYKTDATQAQRLIEAIERQYGRLPAKEKA